MSEFKKKKLKDTTGFNYDEQDKNYELLLFSAT